MNTLLKRRLWLTAGWLTIVYVVVTFAVSPAYTSTVAGIGSRPDDVTKALVTSSMATGYAGAYGVLVASLIFLVDALLIARLLRGEGEVSGWLSSCMTGAAVMYVTILVAIGAAGAGALYAGHHGVSLSTVTALADVGSFGFALSGAAAGLYVLAASAAGQVTGLLPRWFAISGYLAGVVCIAAVPAIRAGAPQVMLWYVWLIVFGVVALRRARASAGESAAEPATVVA